jgi:hypothetical protein
MADNTFQTLLKQYIAHSDATNSNYSIKSKDAQNWFISATNNLNVIGDTLVTKDINQKGTQDYPRAVVIPRQGQMYLFKYDPIGKNTLKNYDRFPLVIVIEKYAKGFLGLNLHYLPTELRLLLLNKLSIFLNNSEYSISTRFFRLSYEELIPFTRYREALPALKRYNFDNVRSRFMKIFADEWLLAALLPVQRFMKKSNNNVYTMSQQRIVQARQGKYGVRKIK